MKAKYISLAALSVMALVSSCDKHDLLDKVVPGDKVPASYWEVGSTACKAGESFSFKGKYYTEDGNVPDRSEVWYEIVREESAAATVKLAGNLKYTQTATDSRIIRENQSIIAFPHSQAVNSPEDKCFVINSTVPTSSTLAPLTWNNPSDWDQQKFDSYYPADFTKEFCDKVIDYLINNESYYSNLRTVYINYNFTNDQFAAVNAKYGTALPTDITTESEADASSDKSDRWFATKTADESKIVGYYYITVQDDKTVINEVPKDYVNPDVKLYPVYESAPWIFCRYDDNAGAILESVREAYLPAFQDLLSQISFKEWIYDSAEQVYTVTFKRDYSLNAQFRVYDTNGHEGIASDVRTISLN